MLNFSLKNKTCLKVFPREAHVDHEDRVPHDVAPPGVEGKAVHLDLVVTKVEGVTAGVGEGPVELGGQVGTGHPGYVAPHRPGHHPVTVPAGRVVVRGGGDGVGVVVIAGAIGLGQVVCKDSLYHPKTKYL